MKEIAEIKSAIKKFHDDTFNTKLRTRWDNDFDLYRLKPYDAGSGYYSYTTNASRILATKAISMITSAKLQIRVHEETLSQEERNIASNIERLLFGILTLINEDNLSVDRPSVVEQMAWHATIRGGFAVSPYLFKSTNGETKPSLSVWDLYNTAYSIGKYGTSWAALTRKVSKEEAKNEYDIDTVGDDVEIIDFRDETNTGVIVGNDWGVKLKPHGLGHCPVYIIHAGSMPDIWSDKELYAGVYGGESIFANNRNILPMINKVISDYATIVRRGVKTPLGFWSAGGKKTLDEDIYQVNKGHVVQLDSLTNEKIAPLVEPTMPADAAALLAIMSGEEQRGGISHIAQGELGFRLSGFAINQLVQQLTEVIVPFLECVRKGLQVSGLCFLDQYSKGGWKPLAVRGRTSRNQVFGMPQAQVISPQDIVGTWHPEFALLPTMPKDDAQNMTLAQMAKQNGLLSLDTIQEDYMGVADPLLEQSKMDLEWADNLIINKLYKAYMRAVEEGKIDIAENIRIELTRVLMSQGVSPPSRPQPGTTGLQREASSMPGVGMPSGETGVPSSVMPSETMGGLPGGAMNATGA